MAKRDEDTPFSLHALIEQTARMLRHAANNSSKMKQSFSKDPDLSNKNKIEQIASLLRSEAKKAKNSKKKKSR